MKTSLDVFALLAFLTTAGVAAPPVLTKMGPDRPNLDPSTTRLSDYLDLDETGLPVDGPLAYPWEDLFPYFVPMDSIPPGILSSQFTPWARVFYAAMGYLTDLDMDPREGWNVPLGREMALQVAVHAFICWQDERWDNGRAQYDFIGQTAQQGWPFVVSETPTFVFHIRTALAPVIAVKTPDLPGPGD